MFWKVGKPARRRHDNDVSTGPARGCRQLLPVRMSESIHPHVLASTPHIRPPRATTDLHPGERVKKIPARKPREGRKIKSPPPGRKSPEARSARAAAGSPGGRRERAWAWGSPGRGRHSRTGTRALPPSSVPHSLSRSRSRSPQSNYESSVLQSLAHSLGVASESAERSRGLVIFCFRGFVHVVLVGGEINKKQKNKNKKNRKIKTVILPFLFSVKEEKPRIVFFRFCVL